MNTDKLEYNCIHLYSSAFICVSLFLLFSSFFCSIANAAAPSPFDAVHVYLVTVGPGAAIYEKFGHNMIRVVGPGDDVDVAFNWGVFSFEQRNFLWRFIQGRMLYSTEYDDYPEQLAEYRQDDRSVWEQELNLSAAQKERLWSNLLWDIQPENRNYRYDYYRDNCSTRSRDAINDVLDDQIRRQLQGIQTYTTYRWHTRRLMQVNVWLYTALEYVLGPAVDRPLNAWQECFLPLQMMQWMSEVHVTDSDGNAMPLVANQRQLIKSTRYPDPSSAPRWTWIYFLIGLALAGLFVGPRLGRSGWRIRLPWGMLAVAWSLLGGACGSILLWGWFCTDHIVTRGNENILQLSPLMLPLIVLIPLALAGKRAALKIAVIFASLQACCGLAGLLLKIMPAFRQPNADIIALALPANVALAIGLTLARLHVQKMNAG
jgi:hypothetical protein